MSNMFQRPYPHPRYHHTNSQGESYPSQVGGHFMSNHSHPNFNGNDQNCPSGANMYGHPFNTVTNHNSSRWMQSGLHMKQENLDPLRSMFGQLAHDYGTANWGQGQNGVGQSLYPMRHPEWSSKTETLSQTQPMNTPSGPAHNTPNSIQRESHKLSRQPETPKPSNSEGSDSNTSSSSGQSPPSSSEKDPGHDALSSSHSDFQLSKSDLALATVPGVDFDPEQRIFSQDELRPQPIIRKRKKHFVADTEKDERYWSRRIKNNIAARRSREARRLKENQIALRAAFLESENQNLRQKFQNIFDENEEIEREVEELNEQLKGWD